MKKMVKEIGGKRVAAILAALIFLSSLWGGASENAKKQTDAGISQEESGYSQAAGEADSDDGTLAAAAVGETRGTQEETTVQETSSIKESPDVREISDIEETSDIKETSETRQPLTITYSGKAYAVINDNKPSFTEAEKAETTAFETYSELDSLERCGVAYANVCREIMPAQERGAIGSVKPSGWHTIKYDVVDGKYLYNRCHLIGYQLAGENANVKNLITGTRYLNIEGMLPFENEVEEYVSKTDNHVLYRVTPVFEGDNLVASGVQMEAWSVEDKGAGICFNVFCFNVQPGVTIDYTNGDSWLGEAEPLTVQIYAGTATGAADAAKAATSSAATTAKPATSAAATTATATKAAAATTAKAATPAAATAPNDAGSDTKVWLSATGSCYHSINNCGRMNPDKAVEVTEAEAIQKGMTKCSKCW